MAIASTSDDGAGNCTNSDAARGSFAIAAMAAESLPSVSTLPDESRISHSRALRRMRCAGVVSSGSEIQRRPRFFAAAYIARPSPATVFTVPVTRGVQTRKGRPGGAAHATTSSNAPARIASGIVGPGSTLATLRPSPAICVTRSRTFVLPSAGPNSLPIARPFAHPPCSTMFPSLCTFSIATTIRSARRSLRPPSRGVSRASGFPATTGF